MLEITVDAFKDSLLILPFIFLVYMLIEIWENARSKEKIEKLLAGNGAAFLAASVGIVPECGFSVMCAKLYDEDFITFGTLTAAFIATSDEGLVVLLSGGVSARSVFLLALFKFIFACFVGSVINLFHGTNIGKSAYGVRPIECEERSEGLFHKFILHPFFHAAKTFLFILAVNLIMGGLLFYIGEERVYSFVSSAAALQPLVTPLIGLIPNCASSILLSEAYCMGTVTFSGLIAGLCSNAGVGLAVVAKNPKHRKKAFFIAGVLYLSGVILGYLTMI